MDTGLKDVLDLRMRNPDKLDASRVDLITERLFRQASAKALDVSEPPSWDRNQLSPLIPSAVPHPLFGSVLDSQSSVAGSINSPISSFGPADGRFLNLLKVRSQMLALQKMQASGPSLGSPLHLAYPNLTPEESTQLELHKANQESLHKYHEFRDQLKKNGKKIKRQRGPTPSDFEDVTPDSSYPCSPATSSMETSPEMEHTALQARKIKREDVKDAAYWERRKKNNEAAKRSRDARRAKEEETAIRVQFLEQENSQLKWEIVRLKSEIRHVKNFILSDNTNSSQESLKIHPPTFPLNKADLSEDSTTHLAT